MPSIPTATKTLALALCVLLTAGAWVPLVTTDRENTITDREPAWEVRTTGTRDDPILIQNVWDLQNMSNDLSADYALANDIDATATKDWNSGAGFEPVGKDWNNLFTGSLDGRNFMISGLHINRSSTNYYVGLFGYIGSGGSVSNVGMENVDITGRSYTGGLVGYLREGSVSNCYATGSVSGDQYVGGLVGRSLGGLLANCYVSGSVIGQNNVGIL